MTITEQKVRTFGTLKAAKAFQSQNNQYTLYRIDQVTFKAVPPGKMYQYKGLKPVQ